MRLKKAVYKTYHACRRRLPKTMAHRLLYYQHHKQPWRAKHPVTYDEKIHWHTVHTYHAGYGCFADKILVRKYVKACGLGHLLIPLHGIYAKAEEIDYGALPEQFVLKTNHASGPDFYVICKNKAALDIPAVTKKLRRALRQNYAKFSCEYHYRKIRPMLLCEAMLTDGSQAWLDDYKVVCHYGKPECILVCSDREAGRDYYDTDWNYLPYVQEKFRSKTPCEKPALLQEMLDAAAVLSKPFPVARVDFYLVGEQLYFGEITLTPSGGNHTYLNDVGQLAIGRTIPIGKRSK